MTDRFEQKLNKAVILFNNGFTSKAAKKRVIDQLNNAYDELKSTTGTKICDMLRDNNLSKDEQAKWHDLYWAMPELHHWKDKHNSLFSAFPEYVAKTAKLIEIRNATKAAEMLVAETPAVEVKVEQVRKHIADEIAKRKVQFIDGLDLTHYFKGLHVSVNAHHVVNDKGTRYVRHFFYLHGKLMALNMILAIFEAHIKSKTQ